jgi:hypothetical protein
MGVHQLPDGNVMRMSGARWINSKMRRSGSNLEGRPFNNVYVARVIGAMEDRGAIDGSDPTSMRRAVELALGRYPARFAELV